MSSELLKIYALAEKLVKNKDEMLQYPKLFEELLLDLRKASKKDEDEYGDGFSVVDDPNEGGDEDEADKWLKEQQAAPAENKSDEPKRKEHMVPWQPRSDYNDKEKAAIEQHMKNGYTHREAERLAGAHKAPAGFRAAMKSGVAPSMMSDKMLNDIKPLAKQWLEEADKKDKLSANPEINPVKHASGKLMEAHEKNTAGFNKDYNEFLGSDKLKGLKGKDRHQAIQEWKSAWKGSNPEYSAGLEGVSNAQKTFGESKQAAKESLDEKMRHIMSGGQSMPTEMSAQEAMQHLGGGKTEEGYQGTISQDPSMSFAQKNPKLLASMKPEQQDRLKRIDSAAKSQGVVRVRKGAPE
jgi:hypothetical protein